MTIELKQHFVAFLDILGFSDMIFADIGSENQPNLIKLFRCHQSAAAIFRDDPNCNITQFSDSIVIATPFKTTQFEWFACKVAEYQRLLLDEGLLCRGGIVVNKHFSNGTFTFSAGVIEAYKVESVIAKHPRVVISKDLIDLIFPDQNDYVKYIVSEDDGSFFIDYIGLFKDHDHLKLIESLTKITDKLLHSNTPSLREKGLWLSNYADAVLSTQFSPSKFRGGNVA